MDNMFKLKIALVFLILVTSYFYLSNPSSLVVNENGKVKGVANKVRVFLQCEKFWKQQYKVAYKMNEQKNSSPKLPSEMYWSAMVNNKEYQDLQRDFDNFKRGNLSPEQYRAEKLREQADRIELIGDLRIMDEIYYEIRNQEIIESGLALPHINERLANATPWYITPIIILGLIISLLISFKF